MKDNEKLTNVLDEIGVDHHSYTQYGIVFVTVTNENYDVEERHFQLKFKEDTGEYFE